MNLSTLVATQFIRAGIDLTIKFTVALLFVCVLCWLLRRRSAEIRHRIWSFGLASGLIIPAGSFLLPQWAIPVLANKHISPVASQSMASKLDEESFVHGASNGASDIGSRGIAVSPDSNEFTSNGILDDSEASIGTASDSSSMSQRTSAGFAISWPLAFIVLWLIGTFCCLARLIFGCWQCHRLVKSAEPAPENLNLIGNAAHSAMNLPFRVSIFLSRKISIPLAIGLRRPVVVLPYAAIKWTASRQRYALLHELGHHERRDVAWQILAQTVCAIYWFHPLAWYAAYRLRVEREFACDGRVVQIDNEAADYAQQLVEIARRASHSPLAGAVAMAQPSGLEQRVVALFDRARSHLPLNWSGAIRIALGMTVCIVALAVAKPVAKAVQIDEKANVTSQTEVSKSTAKNKTTGSNQPAEEDPETRFSKAVHLQKSGDVTQSDAILSELAPDDQAGYAPAHRMRAMSYASQLQNGKDEKILTVLRWHLENSGAEPDVVREKLWTAYFVTIGQLESAVPPMELAAELDPQMLITLANLYAQTGNKLGENRTLRQAESYFEDRLKENPLAREDRLQLALAQIRLNKREAAEATILEGVKLNDDAPMRRSAAEFYVSSYDLSKKIPPTDLPSQLGFLEKALAQDALYGEIYERIIQFFAKAQASKESARIQVTLETMLVEGRSPALAHFALSVIYRIQGNEDKSKFHLFASYRLDGNFPDVANNYAWMLAHSNNPDLQQAYELALTAVRAAPKDPRFRNTYATILMKLGKLPEAIAEFEAIVDTSNDEIRVHRNLAELYSKIGDVELAKKHHDKAIALEK